MSVSLFDFNIYTSGLDSIMTDIKNRKNKLHIISGNAEVLKYPSVNGELLEKFNSDNSIIIPDGISVYLPIKYRLDSNIEKIPGIELMERILIDCNDNGESVYFLGSKDNILTTMVGKLKLKYPNLNIVGSHHGYINIDSCEDVLKDIEITAPKFLFVAMGTPIQEDFIFKYMDSLPCEVYMGVGGSFDVLSGVKSRSPKWVSNIGMEWMYRIFQDRSKIKRLKNNLIFTCKNLFFKK